MCHARIARGHGIPRERTRVYRALALQLRMPGKRPRIRCSGAYASTSGYLDATSVTRHKTHALIRGNENAWTEVDAEASLARLVKRIG